jgi:PKD repeat protein
VPDRSRVTPFGEHVNRAMDVEIAPNGDLLYVDQQADAVQRVAWAGNASNQPPVADAQADAVSGNRPLTVNFDGSGSHDPDAGDLLIYEWDLDGDGQFGDSSAAAPSHTYLAGGAYVVTLRVTDTSGATATDTVTINVGSGPVGAIETPAAGTTWATGETVSFSGSGTDDEDGALPGSALDWEVVLVHCPAPGDCEETPITALDGAAAGSFTAPDADYPAHIEIRLTVTDSHGETDTRTRRIDPRTGTVTLSSSPAGAEVSIEGVKGTAPFARPAVAGSAVTISATSPQAAGNVTQRFSSWSDGQAQTHDVTMPLSGNLSRTARFASHAPGTQTLSFLAEADALVQQNDPTADRSTSCAPTTTRSSRATCASSSAGSPGA